jgi:hypothetical protein
MHLTLPQILILNHAAHVNNAKMDERIERDRIKKAKEDKEKEKLDKLDPVIPALGKRMSECNCDEIASQFAANAW